MVLLVVHLMALLVVLQMALLVVLLVPAVLRKVLLVQVVLHKGHLTVLHKNLLVVFHENPLAVLRTVSLMVVVLHELLACPVDSCVADVDNTVELVRMVRSFPDWNVTECLDQCKCCNLGIRCALSQELAVVVILRSLSVSVPMDVLTDLSGRCRLLTFPASQED